MKTKFTLFILFFISFVSAQTKETKKIENVFKQTKKIEILAYYDRNKWDDSDNPNYLKVNYIKNNKIEINEKYLKNRIVLTQSQIKKLKKRLSSCKSSIHEVAKCYMPRHAIIFYDENDYVFGYIELCFDCNGSDSSPNLKFLSECALRQENLFKEFGITHFKD